MKILVIILTSILLIGCDLLADNNVSMKVASINNLNREIDDLQARQKKMVQERELILSEMHQTDVRIDNLMREIFNDQKAMTLTNRDIADLKKRE